MRCCGKRAGTKRRRRGRTLLFGILAGLALGLLFAPRPGAETMDFLKEKVIRRLPV